MGGSLSAFIDSEGGARLSLRRTIGYLGTRESGLSMKTRQLVVAAALALACFGCKHTTEPPAPAFGLIENDSPANAIERFRLAYEQKKATEYQAMFTGDFTYEFSTSTD